jgi:hypothetical protein
MTIAPSSYRRRLKRGSSVEVPHGFWGTLLENVWISTTHTHSGPITEGIFGMDGDGA